MRSQPFIGTVLLLVGLTASSPDLGAVPPEELTTRMIQERARLYLKEKPATVPEIAAKVGVPLELSPDRLIYERTAKGPVRLRWVYRPSAPLTAEQSAAARQALDQLLTQILGPDYRPGGSPGLLTDAELKRVRPVFEFVPAAGEVLPLADLTTKIIQARVRQYLEENPRTVTEISKRVGVQLDLQPDQVTYVSTDQGPQQLQWRYRPQTQLTPQQEKAAQQELDHLINLILGGDNRPGGRPGLLPEDLKRLQPVYEIVQGEPTTRPGGTTPGGTTPGGTTPGGVIPGGTTPGGGIPGRGFDGTFTPWFVTYYPVWCYRPCMGGWVPAEPLMVVWADASAWNRTAAAGWVTGTTAVARVSSFAEEAFVDDYPKDARTCYQLGRRAYLERDYSVARAYLTRAVQLDAKDARFWFFKAFAEDAMEARAEATASLKRGQALRAQGLPAASTMTAALDRLPPAARRLLASLPPAEAAQAVLAVQR